jgi:hypothetical protein
MGRDLTIRTPRPKMRIMAKSLTDIAAAVSANVKVCSVIQFHGANLFPPADLIYELVAARAVDEKTLELELYLALKNERPKLELHQPSGCRVFDGNLEVKSVAKLVWDGKAEAPPAVQKPGTPALFLGN